MASQRDIAETQRSGDFTCRINGSADGRGFWDAARQSIEDTIAQVRQAVESGDVEHISVFAIAPAPLLFYLGWHLDDKTPTRLFSEATRSIRRLVMERPGQPR